MNLFLPSDPRPIHFVGIAGAGMSALALVALTRGIRVTGSDRDPSGAGMLERAGAIVHRGHDPGYVEGARVVVASAAIPPDHPELERARAQGIPIVSRKVALAGLVAEGKTVGIAGTHGKTTTTVMTTEALDAAGFHPTGLAGGSVTAWGGGNAKVGGSEWFVVEADEYDQAFLTLSPTVAVINNVEVDHLECYGTPEALDDAFVSFARRADHVLIGSDDPGADRIAARMTGPVLRFGFDAADVRIEPTSVGGGNRARVRLPDGTAVDLVLQVPGAHNLRNAAAALGVVAILDGDVARAAEALGRFTGVGRRFERHGEVAGVMVVDDYAHHPTEIRATLAAAREAYPGRRLVVVFQPHLYSRTQLQGGAMGEALALADAAIVTEIYPAREVPIPGVTGALVVEGARRAGAEVRYDPIRSGLADRVVELLRPGDVLLTLGAGDITGVSRDVVALLGPTPGSGVPAT